MSPAARVDLRCGERSAILTQVDQALDGSLAKSFEAQIGMVAAGVFDYVATYKPMPEAIRARA